MEKKNRLEILLSRTQDLLVRLIGQRPSTAADGAEQYKPPFPSAPPALSDADRAATVSRLSGLFARFGIAFLLSGGELVFGARPLGIALLACVPDGALAVCFGMLARALLFGGEAWITASIGFGLWFLRAYGAKILPDRFEGVRRFREGAALQITLGCAAAAAAGIVTLVRGGFLFYDLFGLLVSIASQIPLILAYRPAFDPESRFTLRREAGQAALTMSVIVSALPVRFFGFSLATALAYLLTLYVSKTGGTLRGGVAGFLFGLVCEPILAPVMGLGGLVAGLLWERGVTLAALSALVASIACNCYAEGSAAMLSPAPDLILGVVAILPVLRLSKIPRLYIYAASPTVPRRLLSRGAVAESAEKESQARLKALTDSMESLSEVFYHLSDRMKKPGAAEVRMLCDRCLREQCMRCSLTTLCWVREQTSTADAVTNMTSAICREGILSMTDVPEYLRERCKGMPKIVSRINDAHIDMLEKAARQDKMEVLALDYRAMAGLLSHACRLHAAETYHDPTLTAKLRQTADSMGLGVTYLTVVGKRRLQIVAGGVDPSGIACSPNRIKERFGETLGVTLTPPRFDLESDYVTMSMSTARKFRIESARAGCEKENEPVSGDSMVLFENREDYCYALISDGMGSGREAALTSRMCTVFLKTLLAAGNPKSVAIEMLNNFIRNKNLECFATVDLLEIDLLNGQACFIKSGAAPSYVLRDGKLFRISSSTLPIGITREIRAEEIRFELEAGDTVVLLSDGIAEGSSQDYDDTLWLADLLTSAPIETDSIAAMCEKILRAAQENHQRTDDMTVAMLKIIALDGSGS